MISRDFLHGIGLNEDQITLLSEALEKESRFRVLLESEHVTHIEKIMKVTDLQDIDLSNEDLLRAKIRVEYSGLIPARNNKYQK